MWTYSDREVSDLYKEVFGFRPDGEWREWWSELCEQEKQKEWNWLIDRLIDDVDLGK